MRDIDYILDRDYVPEINENRINDVVSMGQRYMETHTPRKTPLLNSIERIGTGSKGECCYYCRKGNEPAER